jgi:hypothetical protein
MGFTSAIRFYMLLKFMESQSQSQSQSHVTTDGQSVSMSWCQVHSGTRDQMLYSV